jgi:hemerythrin-like domain-containing protein
MSTTITPAVTERPNVHEMVMIHKVFRRIFAALPGLVLTVPAGDRARADVVVAHWDEVADGLHHHHTHEDELLWPKLLDRVTLDRGLVLRAEEQHERIAELLTLAGPQMATFGASASSADGAVAAATLDELHRALVTHMDDEERLILPLVEEHLTVAEWNELGAAGRDGMPKDRLLVQLGFILEGLTPAERVEFLRQMPLAARVAWRLIGRRKYRKERELIYGA